MADFWNFFQHYFVEDKPPVKTSVISGNLERHGGGSHRCAFWAGYDGLKGAIYPPARNGSAADTAYRAGVAYRTAVNAGKRAALPEFGNDHSRYTGKLKS